MFVQRRNVRVPCWLVRQVSVGIGLDHDVNQLRITNISHAMIGEPRNVYHSVLHHSPHLIGNGYFGFTLEHQVGLLALFVLVNRKIFLPLFSIS